MSTIAVLLHETKSLENSSSIHSFITNFRWIKKFSYDREKCFRLSVRYLFYQRSKHGLFVLPLKEKNPNIQKTLFDWPIVLLYDVKAKYQLISGKLSGMKVLISPECLLNQPRAIPVCIRSINHSNRSISFRLMFCFVRVFSFQGHTKIALKRL